MIALPEENPTEFPALPPGVILLGMHRHVMILSSAVCEAWVVTIRFAWKELSPWGASMGHLQARGVATDVPTATVLALKKLREAERNFIDEAESRRESEQQLDLLLRL